MPKVKLALQKLSPDQKVDLANTIKTAMTGNANFPTPNPTLAALGNFDRNGARFLATHLILPGNPSGVTCL